ncbi:MAG: penicillin-binding protein 2 [Candidatus Omnitrophica bacterium CG11_big_fil_rev_8_21_14_0_20_64_10]|nr:MAG: penicillin-binding protein 2 [Candidatus Omnitrophica bacterium CG11_big_fil_rev_8_21_14_0_20_64_10]
MRTRLLQKLIAAVLVAVWLGMSWNQIFQGERFRLKAERNRTRLIHLPASRGPILGRNGEALAQDQLRFRLSVFPQELERSAATWRQLGSILGLPPQELERRYKAGYLAPFAPVPLAEDLTPEQAFRYEEIGSMIPGIFVQPVPRRVYPLGEAVGAVLGYLGRINAEELNRLKPYGYTVQDRVGKDGLERMYDRQLKGEDGGLQLEVDARGRMVRRIGHRSPVAGRPLRVALDGRLQEAAYEALEGRPGAVIVMAVGSGEVLALASGPGFDPNWFLDPDRSRDLQRLLKRPDQPLFNRAIRSAVPPGSIFKMAAAYEGLVEGKIQPDTLFECTGSVQMGRATFRCWKKEGHGMQSVAQALENSCNVFFYRTALRLGAEGIARGARLFGLGRPTGIDLPHEGEGMVPDADWMPKRYNQPWQPGDIVSYGIGQGPLQVTPLQMLMAVGMVGTGSQLPPPHLSLELKPPASKGGRVVLKENRVIPVRIGLSRVVNSPTGTGRLVRDESVRLAGKTGTAQATGGPPHAWFCGYAPDRSPKVAFIVFLEHGGQGGVAAAGVARQVVEKLKELEYL